MTVTVPCPICGQDVNVPQGTDTDGNPTWDATTATDEHIASAHPDYAPSPAFGLAP